MINLPECENAIEENRELRDALNELKEVCQYADCAQSTVRKLCPSHCLNSKNLFFCFIALRIKEF